MQNNTVVKIQMFRIKTKDALAKAEQDYRKQNISKEYLPFAKNTSYTEIAETIVMDQGGAWATPLCLSVSKHNTISGIENICKIANDYLEKMRKTVNLDVLSISARIENGKIVLATLVRPYYKGYSFIGFFNYIGEQPVETYVPHDEVNSGKLLIPDEIKKFKYTEEQVQQHEDDLFKQDNIFKKSDYDHPFLNSITKYVPKKLPVPEDKIDLIYDLQTSEMRTNTVMPYEKFNAIFKELMNYINGVEYYNLVQVMQGEKTEESFMEFMRGYINDNYVSTKKMQVEDLETMIEKLHRALFQMYVLQDFIDDPNVTDIKVTGPDAIRVGVKGKAYISNVNFIDVSDYLRFVNLIAIKNHISLNIPEQTFTDTSDENYILRFSITAEYVNSVDYPYLHIRKIARKKLLAPDLIEAGMFDEKIRDYLIDCGKNSRGVVFAGPPGSGKTVALNWFLEDAYEQSAEILVIQENDELFCYRKGVMFQHVVNYSDNHQMAVNLEQLGQLALVAGANVFVIGEAKGAEICSAITLSNSGCRTAITIHSPSSTETLDKMADLAMRGYAQDYNQAMRMLKSFQTIVYLENFKVKEISEITGYDERTNKIQYNYVYRREA